MVFTSPLALVSISVLQNVDKVTLFFVFYYFLEPYQINFLEIDILTRYQYFSASTDTMNDSIDYVALVQQHLDDEQLARQLQDAERSSVSEIKEPYKVSIF